MIGSKQNKTEAFLGDFERQYNIESIFSTVFSQFHDKMREEQCYENFISDGSVILNIAYQKALLHFSNIKISHMKYVFYKRYMEFIDKIERIIYNYAKDTYSRLYLLKISNGNPFSDCFYNLLIQSLCRYQVNFTILHISSDDFYLDIISEINKN